MATELLRDNPPLETGAGLRTASVPLVWLDGRLTERFSNGFSDVAQREGPDGSILTGRFVDMAHVRSIIEYLFGLGIDVLRFELDPPHQDGTT